jgi:hypothetical protein
MLDLRKCTLEQNKVLENIIKEKDQRRKALSELSFKEKIHILIQLQKMAKGVSKQGKALERIVWLI